MIPKLEQTYLVRKLAPYFTNIGKRLVKSPKVYFRDSGLLHYFLGVRTPGELDVHPGRGASWEGFIIDQILSSYLRHHPEAQAFFWRTARGAEVDLLIDAAGRLIPFEIKMHSAPAGDDVRAMRQCMADLGISRGYVIYPGRERYSLGSGVTVLPAETLLARSGELRRL